MPISAYLDENELAYLDENDQPFLFGDDLSLSMISTSEVGRDLEAEVQILVSPIAEVTTTSTITTEAELQFVPTTESNDVADLQVDHGVNLIPTTELNDVQDLSPEVEHVVDLQTIFQHEVVADLEVDAEQGNQVDLELITGVEDVQGLTIDVEVILTAVTHHEVARTIIASIGSAVSMVQLEVELLPVHEADLLLEASWSP
jgi:hypothetical protein